MRFPLGGAAGWGGLPETEAFCVARTQPQPAGEYELTVRDVPVSGFWSVSVCNRDGCFELNPYDSYSINSVTARPSPDDQSPSPSGLSPTAATTPTVRHDDLRKAVVPEQSG